MMDSFQIFYPGSLGAFIPLNSGQKVLESQASQVGSCSAFCFNGGLYCAVKAKSSICVGS